MFVFTHLIKPPGFKILFLATAVCTAVPAFAQYVEHKGNDVTAPLHLLKPAYVTPYGETKMADIKVSLDRVYNYLDKTTPFELIDKVSGKVISDLKKADSSSIFKPGDYRLTSYEWGVTYTGMLEAAAATGDRKFKDYTVERVNFLAAVVSAYQKYLKTNKGAVTPVRSVIDPHALDDAGSIAAAMIKAQRTGEVNADLRPVIDHYLNYIMTKEFRLKDGTLARNRPQPNTLWLDDLYMSLPAIAQMGVLTGEAK